MQNRVFFSFFFSSYIISAYLAGFDDVSSNFKNNETTDMEAVLSSNPNIRHDVNNRFIDK